MPCQFSSYYSSGIDENTKVFPDDRLAGRTAYGLLCTSDNPIGSLSSEIPKNKVPPMPLENALTLFSQLFGFFISSATLKSHSVASAINCSIIMVPLLNVFCLSILYLASKAVVRDR